jgi:hypothetical protein
MISKSDIITEMQKIVENFNFEQEYRKDSVSSKKDDKTAPTSQE